jgi:dihydrolipoamide dehydrogenase
VAETWDVLVIGAGPGGYPAAIRAAQLGLKTACVEKEKLGGVCLNWGCVPSKALLKTGEFALKLKHADDWGIRVQGYDIDYPAVIRRSRKVAERFEKGVRGLFKKYNVTTIEGTAAIAQGDGVIEVTVTSAAGVERHQARHVVLATGARARVFPGIEVDGDVVLTYRETIVSERRPASAVVIGGGAIGIEFAYFWNALGVSVTVVEGLDEIVPVEDREIGKGLRRELTKQGLKFQLGRKVMSCKRVGEEAVVALDDGTELRAERALVALGIAANTSGIGLEAIGATLDRGRIAVDTSHRVLGANGFIPGVYAVGDCCAAGPALAHTATRQAHVCVERIAGQHVPDVDYAAMPAATYCIPQVASVGLTEEAATAKGIPYKVGKFPFVANAKAVGADHAEGFVKVLIDPKYGEILGAHILGAEASEMIGEFVLARSGEITAEHLLHTVHAHPTNAEAMLEAVATALGVSVHL